MNKAVTTTSNLGQLIRQMPKEQYNAALDLVKARTKEFEKAWTILGKVNFVKAFYETFDLTLKETVKEVSCKKGCHFCCRINVDISEPEAILISEYCKENGIDIPKDRLEEQLKYGWREIAATEAGWCVFLKEGNCSIYPVRPAACRAYHVASEPHLCDTVTYPASKYKVKIAVFAYPEIDLSAFYAVTSERCKVGRLPELLLPYSK